MEKDTVCLSLKEYNELRDFKKDIEENKVVFKIERHFNCSTVLSKDDAILALAKQTKLEIEFLSEKNKEQEQLFVSEINKLKAFNNYNLFQRAKNKREELEETLRGIGNFYVFSKEESLQRRILKNNIAFIDSILNE
jgi:hypothetical protein